MLELHQSCAPSPAEYGLPLSYADWRPNQLPAVEWAMSRPERFLCLCAPTGFGKSLVIMALAHLSGQRTVVLTSTKGLQDQLRRDFESMSTDLRGQANYQCPIAGRFGMPHSTIVADAPCQMGYKCPHRQDGGCEYYDTYKTAQAADIVVTNYQCWMYDGLRDNDINLTADRPVDLLVLDEAHDAESQLAKFMTVELERKDCLRLGIEWPRSGGDQAYWSAWGGEWAKAISKRYRQATEGGRFEEAAKCRKMKRKLERISGMATGDSTGPASRWIIEELEQSGGSMLRVRFAPLWPKRYAEGALFRGATKVVLVSATANQQTAESLGISVNRAGTGQPQPTVFTMREYPSSFPVESRPIIAAPTVQMNYRNEADDSLMLHMIRQVDKVIEQRPGRKGIVHCVSYKRARLLYDNSKWRDRLLIHGSDNRSAVVEKFRTSPPKWGTVLLSPSVDTGYDFPDDMARFQIIIKLPFPNTQDAVARERCKQDKGYQAHVTAQTLQQMAGRVVRSADDWAETFVLDANFSWFYGKNRKLFAKWFQDAVRYARGPLPGPLYV